MNLYIYKYNNYYNRIVKFENSLTDYGEPIHVLQDCKDFTPGDGVNTVHIFGSHLINYNGSGDYLIVTDENNNILSRWFIIDTNFSRQGQWNITMHRDLVVDYYERIINAPCFIEKATLPSNSPFIFNKENITVNQIKTSEKLLKDKSGCAWLIGYYDKTKKNEMSGTVPVNIQANIGDAISINTPIEDWEFYKYVDGTEELKSNPTDIKFRIYGKNVNGRNDGSIVVDAYGNRINWYVGQNNSSLDLGGVSVEYPSEQWANAIERRRDVLFLQLPNYFNYVASNSNELTEILNLHGKTIVDSNGKYFKITVLSNSSINGEESKFITAGALFNTLTEATDDYPSGSRDYITGNPNESSFEVYLTLTSYTIVLNEQVEFETTYDLSDNKGLTTSDSPWNIFAIPYGNITILDEIGSTILETNKQIALTTVMAMQYQKPTIIYDIQLLPYCPVQDLINQEGEIRITNTSQYSFIKSPKLDSPSQFNDVGIIFNVPEARFSFDLTDYKIPCGGSSIEKKLNNECDKWRLASPNYSNYFDFSVEKNNGIQFFNIDCEYKPFTPYIHINPNFNGLYGYDDNSPRGLVCGGDFSLSQVIDQWKQYQIQNKNFQNIFDRQIQNMEVQQNIQRIQEKWQVGLGTAQGAVAGATFGAMGGGGYGAIAGSVVGGAASLAGGIADIQFSEILRTEALDYTKDMFGYQLGNIQALPNTISKISSFNNNNKLFPVLEYYTCTEHEKRAFANKIAWNGMSVGAIGTIKDYLINNWSYNDIESKGYIKGEIIRIENLEDEFHLLKSISDEIYKGVYF